MTVRDGEAAAGGGLARLWPWMVWGLAALFFLYGFFQRTAPSVMHDHLMRELTLSGAGVGNLSAFYFYAYAGLQIPVGVMVDRFGPRRLLAFGALVCGLATFAFSQAESGALAGLYRFLVGFGAGFAFVSALTLAARWLPASRFAQVTGLQMAAGTFGGFLGQAPLAAAVESYGWRESLMASAAFGLLLAVLLWLVIRDFPPGAAQQPRGRSTFGALLRSLARVLTRRQNLLTAFVSASLTAPMLAFAGFWGVAWMMQVDGMTRPEAGAVASLTLLGWTVGAPITGWVSDRIGRRKAVIQAGLLLAILCQAALIYVPELPRFLVWLFFVLLGVAGGCMAVAFALVREHNPVSESGTAFGLVNGAVTGTGAVFQPLIGALLDAAWDGTEADGARIYGAATYETAFTVLPAFLGLALLASFFLKERPEPE